jgi:hypothetical protein
MGRAEDEDVSAATTFLVDRPHPVAQPLPMTHAPARATGHSHRGAVTLLVCLFSMLGVAGSAAAVTPAPPVPQRSQSGSTAEDLEALRRAKMAEVAPPDKDSVEKGLAWLEDGYWIEKIRAGWKGFTPTLGGFPSGSGQAFGVVWKTVGLGAEFPNRTTPNRIDITAQAAASLRGYLVGAADFNVLRIADVPLNLQVRAGWQRNSQEDFYGFGMDSSLEDRTDYLLEGGTVGTAVWWNAPTWLYVGGVVGGFDINVGPGTDERFPPTQDVFPPQEVPGLDVQGRFVKYGGFAAVNYTNRGNPWRGGYYLASYELWDDIDTDNYDFGKLDIDLQQYIPFLMGKRVIALRAKTELTFTDGDHEVPFYAQPILGGHQELRGYNYARFRDRNSLLLAAEYRSEVWMAMDMALFLDAGKVFHDHAQLNFDDMVIDYGFGVRFKTAQSTFLRADFAFGGESFRYFFVFDGPFNQLAVFRRVLTNIQ